MSSHYRKLLSSLREAFPQPVSDPVHDAYVVYSISRALDQVDDLKSQTPILGSPTEPNWEAARDDRLASRGKSLEEVIPELVRHLEGMFIWGHPRSQVNVVPPPSIASVIGVLLPSLYNPNLCSEEGGRRPAEAEVRVSAIASELIGFDPRNSAGVFTFGGTGTMLYGVKIGLEKAAPGCLQRGHTSETVVLASEHCHYSVLNVAGWLGIGEDNVIHVATHSDNSIKLDCLEREAKAALSAGKQIAAIVATMGSTDAFGLDDLESIVAIRDRLVEEFSLNYRPHIHADAVIGWAWCVFDDYDFEANPLGFQRRTIRALAAAQYRMRHLRLADSVGIDFHKTGFAPYISSLVLVRDKNDFDLIARRRETMPYLYQSGEYHPGMFTLETSRSAAGPMAALANLLLLGREGLQTLLGHIVEMAEVLREQVEGQPDLVVLNTENVGPVTLFRVYPSGVDTFTVKERERSDPAFRDQLRKYNAYNRRIFERVYAEALEGKGVAISMTDCYRKSEEGEPVAALKSYVLSPFSDEEQMKSIVTHVLAARDAVDAEIASSESED